MVKPFLRFVRRVRVRAVRLVSDRGSGVLLLAAVGGRRSAVMQWLRRRFIAGFFVTVPLVISVAALVWIFGIIDGFTAPLGDAGAGAGDVPGARHR